LPGKFSKAAVVEKSVVEEGGDTLHVAAAAAAVVEKSVVEEGGDTIHAAAAAAVVENSVVGEELNATQHPGVGEELNPTLSQHSVSSFNMSSISSFVPGDLM